MARIGPPDIGNTGCPTQRGARMKRIRTSREMPDPRHPGNPLFYVLGLYATATIITLQLASKNALVAVIRAG
jgi:hypothetical protein